LNGRADAVALINQLLPDGVAISVLTFGELYEGVYYGPDPRRQLAGLWIFLRVVRVLGLTLHGG
jgi:predicted nucleic acid-binding protein